MFAAIPERLKWQKTGIMIDDTNRSWNFRNYLLILLNVVVMVIHEKQEINGEFIAGGKP